MTFSAASLASRLMLVLIAMIPSACRRSSPDVDQRSVYVCTSTHKSETQQVVLDDGTAFRLTYDLIDGLEAERSQVSDAQRTQFLQRLSQAKPFERKRPPLESDDAPSGRLALATSQGVLNATALSGEDLRLVESCLHPFTAPARPIGPGDAVRLVKNHAEAFEPSDPRRRLLATWTSSVSAQFGL